MHYAKVEGRRYIPLNASQRRDSAPELVAENINSETLVISLSDEWTECDAVAVIFAAIGGSYSVAYDAEGVTIPHEVLETGDNPVYVSVCGYVGETVRLVTAQMETPYTVLRNGELLGDTPTETTPDALEQAYTEAMAGATAANTAADRAEEEASNAQYAAATANRAAATATTAATSADDAALGARTAATAADNAASAATAKIAEMETSITAAQQAAEASAQSSSDSADAASASSTYAEASAQASQTAVSTANQASADAAEALAKASRAYKPMGTVQTYADLPSNPEIGDVYDVVQADPTHGIKAGDNIVWTSGGWDVLSGIVDLTAYSTTAQIADTYATKASVADNAKVVALTQAEYDALATKDTDTIYLIVGA
ncbi:MAG: hypothetical protein IJ113_01090 [Eggerthellaceae bacterium]|nr:hypothetical protein [Eggerthellaceae bacterium]